MSHNGQGTGFYDQRRDEMALFSRKRGSEGDWRNSGIGHLVKVIEGSAPRNYREDREAYYYNYHMMELYRKPLETLLETIGHSLRADEIGDDLACTLFLNLKEFYDPRQKLSLSEAVEDRHLEQRLRQVFLIFYNKKDVDMAHIQILLHKLRE